MNRDSLRPVIVALLAVVVIAVAAATLSSPVSDEQFDRDPGVGGDGGSGDRLQPFQLDFGNSSTNDTQGGVGYFSLLGICLQFLQRPLVIVGLLGLLALSTVPVYRKGGLLGAFSVVMVVLPFGVLFHALLTQCSVPPPQSGGFGLRLLMNQSVGSGNGSAAGTSGGATQVGVHVGLLAIGALFLLLLAFALLRSTDDDLPEPEPESEPEPDDAALAAIGEAAGDAADRLGSAATLQNEVYRAWREMTGHLDVASPQTSTPGEFARAAREAGMNPEHVDELTDLFREVRYGGADPTDEREQRAVEALRRIETVYAGEGEG